MTRTLPALVLALAFPTLALAELPALVITGGQAEQENVVVRFPLPPGESPACNAVQLSDGGMIPAQVAGPAQTDDPSVKQYLVFVLPRLKARQVLTVRPTVVNYVVAPPEFRFVEKLGEPVELVYGGVGGQRPVLQYFHLRRDPADHFYTFKPFHNVYDPATGRVMLTNTSAKTPKDGLFPHHRGLFFGFNRISYGERQSADTWHGTNNVYTVHEKFTRQETGEVLGRHRAVIGWYGPDGRLFASEEREVTVYAVPGTTGTLIDWSTVLTTSLPKVRLDGDPQHAGFHVRAHMEVAQNGKQNTYFLRPDGKGKPGETRNWDPKAQEPDRRTINLPWNAMSFVISGKRYTILRANHPDNPGETRGSERDYGRFGDYFEYDLTPDRPLRLKYRLWVQEGELTVEQCERVVAAFVRPPAVKTAAPE